MKNLKKIASLFFIICSTISKAQEDKTISRNWTSFTQDISVSTAKKVKFKLSASVKRISEDNAAVAGLWVRVDNQNGEVGFFDNMMDRPVIDKEWKTYTIEGSFDKQAKTLNYGGLCFMNGDFYFDDFKLFIQNKEGKYEPIELQNSSFENKKTNDKIPGWRQGIASGKPVKVKEYTISLSQDATAGNNALLVSGRGIEASADFILKPREDYSPQIGTLVSMLDALKKRVESTVQGMDPYELDYLVDEKANRIGALLYHLAAAEKYYQVYTFENRGFNEEEKEKWQAGLRLGEEGRERFQGYDLNYYLKLYSEVRATTLKELKKRDDAWLETQPLGSSMNNFYAWFHVMEHQSSHLGQILFLRKRIPPKREPEKLPKKEEIKG